MQTIGLKSLVGEQLPKNLIEIEVHCVFHALIQYRAVFDADVGALVIIKMMKRIHSWKSLLYERR